MKTADVLLQRARHWDETALAYIYDTYAPAIYRYVYRRTGHADTDEEITAETFHRFLVALKQGGGVEDKGQNNGDKGGNTDTGNTGDNGGNGDNGGSGTGGNGSGGDAGNGDGGNGGGGGN